MSHSKAHRYRLSKFDRPNSYTSTTPADLISSTTRSRDTYRIPASVLDLSNEFTQPFPSPEHSSQYSSTYMNHVNFRYQNIPQPPPLSPNPILPATGPPYVPDSPTSSNTLKRPRWDNQTKWPLRAFNVNSRRLHPTPPRIWIANRTHAYTDYGPTEKTAIQYLASHHHCTLTLFNLSFTLSIFCDDLKIEDEMLWYQVRNKFLSKDIS